MTKLTDTKDACVQSSRLSIGFLGGGEGDKWKIYKNVSMFQLLLQVLLGN